MAQLEQSSQTSIDNHKHSLQWLALRLFDSLIEVHGLPAKTRYLLQLAAAFYQRAREFATEPAHRLGRDLVLAAPLGDQTLDEQALVASVVALQRDKLRPEQEPAFLRLGEKDQQMALRLVALLQIADALGRSPATELHSISVADGEVNVAITGPDPSETVDKGRSKFWRETLGHVVFHAAAPEGLDASGLPASTPLEDERQQPVVDVEIPLTEERVPAAERWRSDRQRRAASLAALLR